ncbi:hypothetical protein GCM10010269_11980 [Streptomyces humidus]|uniref:Uncharacterized protein n=1 Tax=Streptomyces humidus TaxID=52259 RepID=A0A918L1F5_9ACTN|nr:hypothetical protein GCM10010269_11980 [Streptomyces humidus]
MAVRRSSPSVPLGPPHTPDPLTPWPHRPLFEEPLFCDFPREQRYDPPWRAARPPVPAAVRAASHLPPTARPPLLVPRLLVARPAAEPPSATGPRAQFWWDW